MVLEEFEIDKVFFTKSVPMIPAPGQVTLATGQYNRLSNDGRHERLDVVIMGGQPFLRRTSIKDAARVMTIHLASPQIETILWRRKPRPPAPTAPEKTRRK